MIRIAGEQKAAVWKHGSSKLLQPILSYYLWKSKSCFYEDAQTPRLAGCNGFQFRSRSYQMSIRDYLYGMDKKKKAAKPRLIPVIPSGRREAAATDLIFEIVRQIPVGRVTTYGAIAKVLDLPNARMVGHAMRSVDRTVPAQRVVTASGKLSHDTSGARRRLLLAEGVVLKGDKIVDFAKLFWDPAAEL
jgi:methylated-DNA-protein-cysteine methyltransferase-like protein